MRGCCWGSRKSAFAVDIPASLGGIISSKAVPCCPAPIGPIRSLRDFGVLTVEEREARFGVAVGKPVKASSVVVELA